MARLDHNLGKLTPLLIYAVLEWTMIFLLFLDGLLAFASNEFAKYFDLQIPCLLCTRIDHVFVKRHPTFYCNESMCETHKKGISSLAYCQVHGKLSDIRTMCQSCLLAFAADKDSDSDRCKPLVGVLHKDVDCLDAISNCSCCGESLKSKTSSRLVRNLSMNYIQAPSPRASFLARRNEEGRTVESPRFRYLEVMQNLDSKPETIEEDDASNFDKDANRTPRFARENKHLGIRKLSVEPLDVAGPLTGMENDIVNRLKRQVRLDHNSLMELYMELDEERNASNVAANNAMAMITRLQDEKAAVQMEALQYQRMMEEQTEYDEEAFQVMKDMLEKRDEDVIALESELEMYREKYGIIHNKVDADYQERKSDQSLPSFGEDSDSGSFGGTDQNGIDRAYEHYAEESGRENREEVSLDFEGERSYLICLLTDLEKKLYADEGWNSPPEVDTDKHEDEDGNFRKATLTREVSSIKERLRAVEADSGFLNHAATALQKGTDGTVLLAEIAQYLRKIRQSIKSPSDNIEA